MRVAQIPMRNRQDPSFQLSVSVQLDYLAAPIQPEEI